MQNLRACWWIVDHQLDQIIFWWIRCLYEDIFTAGGLKWEEGVVKNSRSFNQFDTHFTSSYFDNFLSTKKDRHWTGFMTAVANFKLFYVGVCMQCSKYKNLNCG